MKSTKRYTPLGIAAVAMAVVMTTTATANAQEDNEIDLSPVPASELTGAFEIDDGDYVAGTSHSLSMTLSRSSLVLLMVRSGSGSADFVVRDGEMDGEWSMSETSLLTFPDQPSLATAEGTGTGEGTLTGSFPYIMAGSYFTEATGTATMPVLGISATDSGSDTVEMSFVLGNTSQVCDQIVTNWDLSFTDLMTSFGWEPSINTQMTAFSAANGDEFGERISELLVEGNVALNSVSDPVDSITAMADILGRAEKLMSDIESYPDTCSADVAFLRVINQILRDFINSILDHWSNHEGVRMILLRRLISLGLRGGILGSGATDPTAAKYLTDKITDQIQQTFDELIDSDPTGFDEDELRQALIAANMLGYEVSPDISNEDVCLGLGGC